MFVQESFGGVSPSYFCGKCGRPLSNPISVNVGMGPICRGHRSGLEGGEVERDMSLVNWHEWGTRFDFTSWQGTPSHCLILANRNCIICTEAWDNDGISITNAAEEIATLVCQKYGIPLEKLVWIEHYVHDEPIMGPAKYKTLEHTFDAVAFEISGEARFPWKPGLNFSRCLRHPDWKPITKGIAVFLFDKAFPDDAMAAGDARGWTDAHTSPLRK